MKTGLALSGGGIKGLAHIGVLKALEEHRIRPSHIAGTSAGAIVGALYAAGLPWQEILRFFNSVNLFSLQKYAWKKPGLMASHKFYQEFKAILPGDSFDALKIPLYITTTNILDGSLRVFEEGKLILPILASAAFPGVFTPVRIDGDYYIDGGTLNNFPVDLVAPVSDRTIGVFLNPFEKIEISQLKTSLSVLERAYKIISNAGSIRKFGLCDILICPKDLNKYGTFTTRDRDTIFDLGYTAAMEALGK